VRTGFSTREKVFATVSVLFGVALVFTGRQLPLVDAKERPSSNLFEELKVFTDVLSVVKRDYVSDVENKKLVEGAIKGMLPSGSDEGRVRRSWDRDYDQGRIASRCCADGGLSC